MNTRQDFLHRLDSTTRSPERATAKDDFAEAARLITDLARLVDAGLVVVEESFSGPARYRVTCGEVHAA